MRKSNTLSKIKNFCLLILFLIANMGFAQTKCPKSDFEMGTLSGWEGQTSWWLYSPSPATECLETETMSYSITSTTLNNHTQRVK
jgi:hypothetical protein